MIRFSLDEEQEKKLLEWINKKDFTKYSGAIGGRFTYSFTPTSLGLIIKVQDSMGEKDEIDLTDYSSW